MCMLDQETHNRPSEHRTLPVKPGMLIRGIRLDTMGVVLSVHPLVVATSDYQDGLIMSVTPWIEVKWPWDDAWTKAS